MESVTGAIGGSKSSIGASIMLSGAEIVKNELLRAGITQVFSYQGGMILPAIREIEKDSLIRNTPVRHEQGAAFAADAYWRSTGKLAGAMATSGPGALNLVTGLATAYADSSAVLAITGQVTTPSIGTHAFQEAPICAVTKEVTKWNYQVKDISKLSWAIREGVKRAQSGRPRPVLIDIPKDIQTATMEWIPAAASFGKPVKRRAKGLSAKDELKIRQAVALMQAADRPVFYTGGGVIGSGDDACAALRELVYATGFPITQTLMGLGAYPGSGPHWIGMLGMYGAYRANKAMHGADLIIAVGARFDDRVTGQIEGFAPGAKIVHIDIDKNEIGKIVPADVGIVADSKKALRALLKAWNEAGASARSKDLDPWWKQIDAWKRTDDALLTASDTEIKPYFAMNAINEAIKGKDAYVVTDVGQNQMWAAKYINVEKPKHFLSSGGMGTMGWGLPAALGVQIAHPEALVVCSVGDGGYQMTAHEMATAKAEGLPIKLVIFDNDGLGMVRQVEEAGYGNRYSESTENAHPDFLMNAKSFGWKALSCASPKELPDAVNEWMEAEEPCALVLQISRTENVLPVIKGAHNEMTLG